MEEKQEEEGKGSEGRKEAVLLIATLCPDLQNIACSLQGSSSFLLCALSLSFSLSLPPSSSPSLSLSPFSLQLSSLFCLSPLSLSLMSVTISLSLSHFINLSHLDWPISLSLSHNIARQHTPPVAHRQKCKLFAKQTEFLTRQLNISGFLAGRFIETFNAADVGRFHSPFGTFHLFTAAMTFYLEARCSLWRASERGFVLNRHSQNDQLVNLQNLRQSSSLFYEAVFFVFPCSNLQGTFFFLFC